MSDSRIRVWFTLFVLAVFCVGLAGGGSPDRVQYLERLRVVFLQFLPGVGEVLELVEVGARQLGSFATVQVWARAHWLMTESPQDRISE